MGVLGGQARKRKRWKLTSSLKFCSCHSRAARLTFLAQMPNKTPKVTCSFAQKKAQCPSGCPSVLARPPLRVSEAPSGSLRGRRPRGPRRRITRATPTRRAGPAGRPGPWALREARTRRKKRRGRHAHRSPGRPRQRMRCTRQPRRCAPRRRTSRRRARGSTRGRCCPRCSTAPIRSRRRCSRTLWRRWWSRLRWAAWRRWWVRASTGASCAAPGATRARASQRPVGCSGMRARFTVWSPGHRFASRRCPTGGCAPRTRKGGSCCSFRPRASRAASYASTTLTVRTRRCATLGGSACARPAPSTLPRTVPAR